MKKKILATALSFVFVFTAMACAFNSAVVQTVSAEETKVLSEELDGYTKVSFSDFLNASGNGTEVSGAPAGTTVDTFHVFSQRYYQSATVEAADSYSLDHTYLDFDLKTGDTTVPMIALYEKENWHDYVRLTWSGNVLTATYVNDATPADRMSFNLTEFGRASSTDFFNVKIRSDFSANSTDASRRDAKLQFWFNDLYAGEMNLTSTDLRNGLWVRTENNETIYIREPAVMLETSPEADFDFWSYSHLGIANQTKTTATNNWVEGTVIDDSIDKTVFRAKINFPASNMGNWYVGNGANWYGFTLTANGSDKLNFLYNCQTTGKFHNSTGNTGSTSVSGNQIAILDPAVAGTTLRGNANLDFALSVEYFGENDGIVNLKVGVFLDGKLYNSRYFVVRDVPKAELVKSARIYNATFTIASAYGPKDMATELSGYRRVDMFDYNKTVTNGVVSFAANDTATAYLSDFDKTYLDVDVNYGGNTTWGQHMLQYQGVGIYQYAIYLGFNGANEFRLTNYKNEAKAIGTVYKFIPADFGISPSAYFNIKLRTDIVTVSATVENVFVQLWLNNTFAFEGLLQFTYGEGVTHDKSYMGTAKCAVSVQSSTDASTHLAGIHKVVAEDFTVVNGTMSETGRGFPSALAGEYTGNASDLTECYFEADIKTPNGMDPFMVWLSKNKTKTEFYGDGYQLRFYLDGTTMKMKKVSGGSNAGIVSFGDISVAPYNYSASEFFNLKIKTDIYGANSVRLIIWINDQFLKNVYITTYDAETLADMTCAGFRGTDANTRTYVRTAVEAGDAFAGYTLTLNDDVDVNFFLNRNRVPADATVTFAWGDKETDPAAVTGFAVQRIGKTAYYKLVCDVAAKEMGQTITATVCSGETVLDTDTTSVAECASYYLNGDYSASLKNLMNSMLNYGAKAQRYFDYDTVHLAVSDYDPPAVDWEVLPLYRYQTGAYSTTIASCGLAYEGNTLVLKSKTTLRLFFTVTGEVGTVTFSDGTPVPYEDDKSGYRIYTVSGIAPADLADEINIRFNGTAIPFSALTYIRTTLKKYATSEDTEKQALVTLMKSLYDYHQKADAYF